jgi:kumamolisin
MSLRSSGDAGPVDQWLRAGGLRAATIDAAGTLVSASGTARDVEARLGVVLVHYRVGGVVFHRPLRPFALPATIATRVRAVLGLDDYSGHLVAPDFGGRSLDACVERNACMTRAEVAKAFDLDALYAKNILGNGHTVAIVNNGPIDKDDLNTFDREEGIAGPIDVQLETVDPLQDVDTNDDAVKASREEVTMDVETVHMIAPAAKIIYYQTSFAGMGAADAYAKILSERKATIVSQSFGECADSAPAPGSPEAAERDELAKLKQAHINVFVSSSDHGAFTCIGDDMSGGGDPKNADWHAVADWPADSPDVVAVGGTYLTVGADGSYGSEAAWVNPLTNWSTGGGVSPNDAAPPWQTGPGFAAGGATANRQYPDVAGPGADAESGWTIHWGGNDDRSSGTSAATPFWAGYMALVRQAAAQAHTGTFPFIAPVLYAVASSDSGAFHDIVSGSNLEHQAGPGRDDSTGLGSPVGGELSDAIVAYLRAHPNAAAND